MFLITSPLVLLFNLVSFDQGLIFFDMKLDYEWLIFQLDVWAFVSDFLIYQTGPGIGIWA